jgi:hypothetical protein
VVGFELVAVFDELWVLAVPPLMVGSTLIMGWMLIAGATMTVWTERELMRLPDRPKRSCPLDSCVFARSWWAATCRTATA